MASKSVTLNSDVSQCSICLEEFTQPKFLDCFHTFCMECIRDLNQTSPGTVCCPLCQRQVQLPAGGVEQLTSNFYIININTDNNCNCKSTSNNSITTNSITTNSITTNSTTTISNIKKHERGTQTVESEINCSRQSVYIEYNCLKYPGSFSVTDVEFDGVTFDLHPGRFSSDKWGDILCVRIQISKSSSPFVKSCDIDYDISLVNRKDREYSARQTGSCTLVRNTWSDQIYLITWSDANDKDNCFYQERDEIRDQCRIRMGTFQLAVGIRVKNKTMTNFDLK